MLIYKEGLEFHLITTSTRKSHCCANPCPPNMCKGLITDRIQNTVSELDNKRFIYLGGGTGDYCPSLRLREIYFVMPRKNYPVWDLICKDPSLVKAQIHGWCDGEEFELVLMKLINKIMIEDSKFSGQQDKDQRVTSFCNKHQSYNATNQSHVKNKSYSWMLQIHCSKT